jgi:hypothetical protein
MKIGIVRVLDQKIDTFFWSRLSDVQKRYRVANFSFSTKVSITFYVPTQWVFSVKISDLVRWKGIAMSKNKKIKNQQQQFFFCSDDLKWNCSKNDLFKNWKNHKLTTNIKRTFAQSRFSCLTELFYLWLFKDGRLLSFVSFVSFLRHLVF